jgi:hypothetical protein
MLWNPNHVVPRQTQALRQALFSCRPPSFAASDQNYRLRVKVLGNSGTSFSAQNHINSSLNRAIHRYRTKPPYFEFWIDLRTIERERVRHDLRDQNANSSPKLGCEFPGSPQGTKCGRNRCI